MSYCIGIKYLKIQCYGQFQVISVLEKDTSVIEIELEIAFEEFVSFSGHVYLHFFLKTLEIINILHGTLTENS